MAVRKGSWRRAGPKRRKTVKHTERSRVMSDGGTTLAVTDGDLGFAPRGKMEPLGTTNREETSLVGDMA